MINTRFNIKKKLGKGRSTVYLCEDIDFPGKSLAIKVLDNDVPVEEVKGLKDEYFILRKLNHPNIIKANEIGTIVDYKGGYSGIHPGSKFITMEYFEGSNLLEYEIRDESILIEIITQICSVLFYLHQSNYIYYDLKPQNILVNETDGMVNIKLIDLGLARLTYEKVPDNARGTAEYIAPELLIKEVHDHRVDLYSFGMLLYRLIYKQYPFNAANELDIYKAHLAGDFNFPVNGYPEILISVVQKLLAKDPSERYYTSLQVLQDLEIPVDGIKKDWVPAKAFTGRKDVLSIIDTFFNRHTDGEVLALRGTEGSGKTSVLEEVYRRYNATVYIKSSGFDGNAGFWKILLREIVFADFIYVNLSEDVLNDVNALLETESGSLVESIKAIVVRIVKDNEFILLLDDYNRYDDFSLEIIKQLMPVFQVNNIKVVLTEDSSYPYLANEINNLLTINLSPFTEAHLIEYLDKSFADFFPKKEVMKMIMMYADLLPGSIDAFLKDLVLLDALEFKSEGPEVIEDTEKIKLLTASQDSIYNLQLKLLTQQEYLAAQYLSLFDISLRDEVLAVLLNVDHETASGIIKALREKNIILQTNISVNPEFTSSGLKKYIYSNIREKDQYHKVAAEIIRNSYSSFNRIELARQYELAGLYRESYEVLKAELESAEKLSAYSFKKKLLLHLLEYPLPQKDLLELKYSLVHTTFRIGDKKYALELIEKLLDEFADEQKLVELKTLKGNCLISTGEQEEGISVLTDILPLVFEKQKQYEVLFDIASAYFDMNDYTQSVELCRKIINEPSAGGVIKGKVYNLLALVEIYSNDNDAAIGCFEKALDYYKREGLYINVAGVEMNLGNIYCMKTEFNKAEEHWNKALEINSSIGNLEQEVKLLNNYGVYFFYKPDYEAAADNYRRANTIFSSLGDKTGEGWVLLNLGEIYLHMCNYSASHEALLSAKRIFYDLRNYDEEAEVLLILARYYFILGDDKYLVDLLTQFNNLIQKAGMNDKYLRGQLLIESLTAYARKEFDELPGRLKELSDYYHEKENNSLCVFTIFLACDIYLKRNEHEECLELLKCVQMEEFCEKNILVSAERNYYLGKLSEMNRLQGLKSPVEYYEEALSLIQEQSITEITWKLMSALIQYFVKRGAVNKAEEYIDYLKSIFEFIIENIKDNYTRQVFISKPERKAVLDQLSE